MAKYFRPIARLWVRGCDKNDGMIHGVAFKGTRDILKANTVYELQEIMGDIVLKEMGPSCVGNKPHQPGYGQTIEGVMDRFGKHIILTKAEYKEQCNLGEK